MSEVKKENLSSLYLTLSELFDSGFKQEFSIVAVMLFQQNEKVILEFLSNMQTQKRFSIITEVFRAVSYVPGSNLKLNLKYITALLEAGRYNDFLLTVKPLIRPQELV